MFLGCNNSVLVGWPILVAASCFLRSSSHQDRSLQLASSKVGRVSLLSALSFAVLGLIDDSEYVDSMGTVGRRCSMSTLVGLV